MTNFNHGLKTQLIQIATGPLKSVELYEFIPPEVLDGYILSRSQSGSQLDCPESWANLTRKVY